MPFRVALSGLNASSADLEITGNNIANSNTHGFKASRGEFADVYAVAFQGISSTAIGNGVRLADVSQQFSQGNIDFTDNSLDLAINGQGFFIMENANGASSYTRAGAFHIDRDGFIVNSSDSKLQIFPAINNGAAFNTGVLSDLQLSLADGQPQSTGNVTVGLNLPANAAVPTVAIFDPNNPLSYTNSTSTTVYDSLGGSHLTNLYYVKDAVANTWDSYVYVDGNYVDGPDTLVYDNTGALSIPVTGQITTPAYTPANGAADITLTFNYSNTSQYGAPFAVNTLSQDGFAAGRLAGIDIDADGVVFARFTNGRSNPLGKVALANFPNPQGLRQLGDTSWDATFAAGDVLVGEGGTASFGLIQSGALESSNVEMTEQLVSLITSQRNFQANAQVLTTADTITQTIINIR